MTRTSTRENVGKRVCGVNKRKETKRTKHSHNALQQKDRCKQRVNGNQPLKPYRVARVLYFTMQPGDEAKVYDVEMGKKIANCIWSIHHREQNDVLFKTKTTKDKKYKIWRAY